MAFTKVDYVNGETIIMAENLNAIQAEFDLKANLNAPTFTGEARAVTPPSSDNSTRIATTKYVKDNIGSLGNIASLNTVVVTS